MRTLVGCLRDVDIYPRSLPAESQPTYPAQPGQGLLQTYEWRVRNGWQHY